MLEICVVGLSSLNDTVGTSLANQSSSCDFRLPISSSSLSTEHHGLPSSTSPAGDNHPAMAHSLTSPVVSVVQVRLDHELQKSRVAKSQINFLKSQLASETAARVDAQVNILFRDLYANLPSSVNK